jgi:hypothetical protein
MANVKISELAAASTPLAGTEVLPIVQSGGTVKASIANVQTAVYPGGTANGVAFLNGSKVLTTGTALAFDGANLGIGTSSPNTRLHAVSSATNTVRIQGTSSKNLWSYSDSQSVGWGTGTGGTGGANYTNLIVLNDTNSFTAFYTSGAEAMRLDSSGNLGLGVTPSAASANFVNFQIGDAGCLTGSTASEATYLASNAANATTYIVTERAALYTLNNGEHAWSIAPSGTAGNAITFTQAMTLDDSGDLLVGKTATSLTVTGSQLNSDGTIYSVVTTGAAAGVYVNRQADDGVLISLRQANTQEGNISVAGTTVSYNGGHLSRWAQTTTAKDDTLVKGTVLSNLDEMNVYTDAEGNPVANEQLNKVKVSDTEGDANVAGVFVNWTHDEQHNVDEINMAMTGDMIIRIAQGVTVVRGDLLMSAGDGTAKPQGDDIVRSKTVAKVTSNHVTCTYADGSYCVPCVLMAC